MDSGSSTLVGGELLPTIYVLNPACRDSECQITLLPTSVSMYQITLGHHAN